MSEARMRRGAILELYFKTITNMYNELLDEAVD
jgi:hypothetical protein